MSYEFNRVPGLIFRRKLIEVGVDNPRVWENCYIRDLRVYEYSYCFITDDGKTGVAITEDHEAISLFNIGRPGMGKKAMDLALDWGATHLVCTPELIWYYEKFGFVKVDGPRTIEDIEMVLEDIL